MVTGKSGKGRGKNSAAPPYNRLSSAGGPAWRWWKSSAAVNHCGEFAEEVARSREKISSQRSLLWTRACKYFSDRYPHIFTFFSYVLYFLLNLKFFFKRGKISCLCKKNIIYINSAELCFHGLQARCFWRQRWFGNCMLQICYESLYIRFFFKILNSVISSKFYNKYFATYFIRR